MNAPSAFQASALPPTARPGDGGPRRGGIDKRALALALLVHALLVAALAWGVGWKRDTSLAVEAELWAAVPQEMAPRAQPAPPEPTPPTPPEPEPTPEPAEPPPPPPPSAQAQAQREAEINLEREREEQARKDRAEAERKARIERQERENKERERKLAEEKRRKDEAERREREATELREQMRQENIRRMAGLADATPQPNAAGKALRTAGPSATYAGRIRARIKPNIVFPDNLSNTNISAEVKVSTSPDGAVTSRTLTKSSGNRLWDEAVLRAIDKTAILPKDTDGKVPPELIISFTPRD